MALWAAPNKNDPVSFGLHPAHAVARGDQSVTSRAPSGHKVTAAHGDSLPIKGRAGFAGLPPDTVGGSFLPIRSRSFGFRRPGRSRGRSTRSGRPAGRAVTGHLPPPVLPFLGVWPSFPPTAPGTAVHPRRPQPSAGDPSVTPGDPR